MENAYLFINYFVLLFLWNISVYFFYRHPYEYIFYYTCYLHQLIYQSFRDNNIFDWLKMADKGNLVQQFEDAFQVILF